MSDNIDISGIDKPYLLMKLFNAAKYHIEGRGTADWKPDGITIQEARALLRNDRTDIRVIDGRHLHVALGGDTMNPNFYDKYNGQGLAQHVVHSIRKDMVPGAAFRPTRPEAVVPTVTGAAAVQPPSNQP